MAVPRHIFRPQAESCMALVGHKGKCPGGNLTCVTDTGVTWRVPGVRGQSGKHISKMCVLSSAFVIETKDSNFA